MSRAPSWGWGQTDEEMKQDDVIREVESMVHHCTYSVAKTIVKLAGAPVGTVKSIGKGDQTRDMSQEEALHIVEAAKKRIELVDSGG